MTKEIEDYFEDFIVDRAMDVEQEIINKNTKTIELGEECTAYFRRILASMPVKDKKLLFRYEEKRNHRAMLCFQMLYRQGLIDGFKASNVFNEIRNRDVSHI